jgi:hypothetical protein
MHLRDAAAYSHLAAADPVLAQLIERVGRPNAFTWKGTAGAMWARGAGGGTMRRRSDAAGRGVRGEQERSIRREGAVGGRGPRKCARMGAGRPTPDRLPPAPEPSDGGPVR